MKELLVVHILETFIVVLMGNGTIIAEKNLNDSEKLMLNFMHQIIMMLI